MNPAARVLTIGDTRVMLPKVSILIPTYQRPEYLREALGTAMSQSHPNLEVIVLDDASPDHTPEVAHEFLHDPRVRYVRQRRNLGSAANWSIGFEEAAGDFFCLLHDDDTYEPRFVESLLRPLIDDPGLILAFCDHWVVDHAGRRLRRESSEASRRFRRSKIPEGAVADLARTALVDLSVPVGAALFRRSMIDPEFFDSNAKGSIDAWLLYRCVKTGYGGHYVPARLMNYRSHSGGMSVSSPLYMAEGHLYRYQQILRDPAMEPLHAEIRMRMSGVLTDCGIHHLVSGNLGDARFSLEQALAIRGSWRARLAYLLAREGEIGVKAAACTRRLKRLSRQVLRHRRRRGGSAAAAGSHAGSGPNAAEAGTVARP